MPHIHTAPGQIDATVSAYIILQLPDTAPRILLHKHRRLGVLLQFGGHIELHETPWQAVAHEITEESGYDVSTLHLMQPPGSQLRSVPGSVIHPQPLCMNTHSFGSHDHYHSDTAYLFIADAMPAAAPAAGESNDIGAYGAAQIAALDSGDLYDDTRRIITYIFDEVLSTWQSVPAGDFLLSLPPRR